MSFVSLMEHLNQARRNCAINCAPMRRACEPAVEDVRHAEDRPGKLGMRGYLERRLPSSICASTPVALRMLWNQKSKGRGPENCWMRERATPGEDPSSRTEVSAT